ncbi:MAG: recombinase family protein [Oscillospiraceae bacterium]|nr:recombinase family protein [Oscillospiraceae bacterium]
MMGKRKTPFGYMIRDGEIVLHPEECAYVRLIFDQYQKGTSLKELAEYLRNHGVIYDVGKCWNKNMVARILENERYTGQLPYPELVTPEQYQAVIAKRKTKWTKIDRTEKEKLIRRMCDEKITADIEQQIIHLINQLIRHPEQIQWIPNPTPVRDDITLLEKRIDDLLMQQPVNEEAVRQLIGVMISAEYDLIQTTEYETEYIRRILMQYEQMEELDETLLREVIEKIFVSAKGEVGLKLKNGQIITKRRLRGNES